MNYWKIFNLKKLRESDDLEFIALDIMMLVLVSINLLLIVFELSYSYQIVREFAHETAPIFFAWYHQNIHLNFFLIDLAFVAVFILELLFRWGVAIYRKTYHSWIFYPFIHWYDVLGCMPISGFRFLRILRVFSMIYRLERMGVLNLRNTWIFKQGVFYYKVFLEEVSDRVVINVIDGVKAELANGNPVSHRIVEDVLVPQKEEITEWISESVESVLSNTYQLHRNEIKTYIDTLMVRALEKNKEVMTIELVPILGSYVTQRIEKLIGDIVFNVINEAIEDIAKHRDAAVEEVASLVFDGLLHTVNDEKFNDLAEDVISETLDIVKAKVSEKQWQLAMNQNKKNKSDTGANEEAN